MTRVAYVERAQFVIAPPDAGKSSNLRSMFLHHPLGGAIPTDRKIKESYHLTRERRLHIMLSSPHEMKRTLEAWLDLIEGKLSPTGRWCIAGALQPDSANSMPDCGVALSEFKKRFHPERLRAVFLNPDRHGSVQRAPANYAPDLHREGIEVISVDAREKHANAWVLADFFDFS
jgi:hypothetical protein